MKRCTKCGKERALSEFRKSSTTKDKLTSHCRLCLNAYSLQYRKVNKEYFDEYDKAYRVKNAKVANQRVKEWIKNNPERRKEQLASRYEHYKTEGRLDEYYGNTDKEQNRKRSKRWRELNTGQVSAQIAHRRALKLQAVPVWAEHEQIAALYGESRRLTETTGIAHQVDHIVPLKSNIVCGLHCKANLRIVTAEENNRKKCKLDESLLR
ncbi:MAG: hypothetical protein E4H14_02700 [Candidatus Thorarchaeota archaeon]|nr:MAG: hypothetical protein E4H14_02700 [Candidatus Thorarchaeota archaeon]